MFGGIGDGDFSVANGRGHESTVVAARQELVAYPWSWLSQVHGSMVHRVIDEPITAIDGDGLATALAERVLSVTTADCAPLVLWGSTPTGDPVVAICHAGWRGLADGVVDSTVRALRELGAEDVHAILGPCISPRSYEFGSGDLTTLALQFGPDVIGATESGRPALDLRAAIRSAAMQAGVHPISIRWLSEHEPPCTAADDGFFSWRANQDKGRNLSAVWIGIGS